MGEETRAIELMARELAECPRLAAQERLAFTAVAGACAGGAATWAGALRQAAAAQGDAPGREAARTAARAVLARIEMERRANDTFKRIIDGVMEGKRRLARAMRMMATPSDRE